MQRQSNNAAYNRNAASVAAPEAAASSGQARSGSKPTHVLKEEVIGADGKKTLVTVTNLFTNESKKGSSYLRGKTKDGQVLFIFTKDAK